MKKQILVSSIIAAGILGGTGLIAINNRASAEESTKSTTNTPIAANTDLVVAKPINTTKNETVYVMTDEAGNAKTRFIGSTIYDGPEALPFSFTVNYYLDNQEISGKDLKGKSGHVKIVYHYDSTAFYQGKKVPFLAITGITLDHGKFSGVKVSSGKIISESSDNYIIAGYGLAGVNQDLGTDFLPDSFTLEADTTDFSLENTYTIFTNDILADLDTSKLNDLDNLTSSVYQLEDGINKLVNGASDLSNGLASALDGTKQLYDGSKTLAAGAKDAADGAAQISTGAAQLKTGLATLTSYNIGLQTGARQVFDSLLMQTLTSIRDNTTLMGAITLYGAQFNIVAPTTLTIENYSDTLDSLITFVNTIGGDSANLTNAKNSLTSYNEFYTGLLTYTNSAANAATGASSLADGLSNLSTGLAKLSTGANTLSVGLGSLVEGETKLYQGSITLKDGLSAFKSVGIDKLVNFASKDLANFTRNARTTINAAGSYKSFGGVDANSVKFIVKTPSI